MFTSSWKKKNNNKGKDAIAQRISQISTAESDKSASKLTAEVWIFQLGFLSPSN